MEIFVSDFSLFAWHWSVYEIKNRWNVGKKINLLPMEKKFKSLHYKVLYSFGEMPYLFLKAVE